MTHTQIAYATSLSFASPVWAAIKNGHEVVFVDVDENILFDVSDFKKKYLYTGPLGGLKCYLP